MKKVTVKISNCGISGPPGIGKSHLRALLLDKPYPEDSRSTTVLTTADEIIPGKLSDLEEFVKTKEKKIKGEEDKLTWTVMTKDSWANLMASTLFRVSEISPEDICELQEEYQKHRRGCNIPGLVGKILTKLKKIDPFKKSQRKTIEEFFFIYLVDTGGQPQFQEILPNFIRSSINILVSNLSTGLYGYPEFSYEVDGKKYEMSDCMKMNNLSIIEQSVRSVCSVVRTSEEETMEGVPAIALVGTFKDKFKDNDLRDALQEWHVKLSHQLAPFKSGIKKCEFLTFKHYQLVFPIDGSKDGWSTNEEALEELRGRIHENIAKVEMPLWHVVLMQNLKDKTGKKKDKRHYLTLKECIAIGKSCQVDLIESDIEEALRNFHSINTILYFPEILKDIVFINPSFLYEMVTDIIVRSFQESANPFHKTGIITKDSLQSIPSFKMLRDGFDQNEFLKLLQGLLIIADIGRGEYFMPCVLPLESFGQTYEPTSEFGKKQVEFMTDEMTKQHFEGPLVISFGDGISPRGLFCSIIVELSHKYKWKLTRDKSHVRKRNMIEFSVYSYNKTTSSVSSSMDGPTLRGSALIFDKTRYLEVYSSCGKDYCYVIHHAIRDCLHIACNKMKYSTEMLAMMFGLYCKKCNSPECHPSECSYRGDISKWVENCTARRSHDIPLSARRKVWFSRRKLDGVAKPNASAAKIDEISILRLIGDRSHIWKKFATHILASQDSIKRIEKDYDKCDDRLIEVISCWKHHAHPPFTWATLEAVFRKMDEIFLANKIKDEYLK